MHIITVLPVTRGILKGHLTYFAKEAVPTGSVIMVPLRNHEVPALVIETSDAANAKISLKSSDFAVRKISHLRPRQLWTPPFLRAAEKTAHYFAQGFGETILSLTPKTILDARMNELLKDTAQEVSTNEHASSNRSNLFAIQENTEYRMESYQRYIRESFVRGESLFICLPSSEDVERVSKILQHGIEQYVFPIHNELTKKNIIERWEKIGEEKHAIVVVGTPQYLALPRFFKTIIVDEEHARTWRTIARPHLDLRTFIEYYASETGSRLIFGAPILRTETHARIKDGAIDEWGRIALHARTAIETTLVDPRAEEKEFKERTGKRVFQTIGASLKATITNALQNNDSIILVTARKGLAPITACGDCGTAVRCPECEAPLVIHKRDNDRRVFTCHSCGFMRAPEDGEHETCRVCGSWRLEGLGIGTEQVVEVIKKLFPDNPCLTFDGDHVRTLAQARKLIAQFEKQKGAILVATPMVLSYLYKVDHAIVVSVDSLFAIPDFRMHERIFAFILALKEKTKKTLSIQTRTDDTTIFTQALTGDLAGFTENELALRKAFSYPPYGTIIKITVRGKREAITKEMEDLKTYISEYEPIVPNTLAKETRGLYRMHLILKLADKSYPNDMLIAKLRALPPQFTVEINPDHLL